MCNIEQQMRKTPQEVEKKTMEERKNLLSPLLFEQRTPHFYFAQSPVNYIAGPDPRPFYPAIHKLYVPLGIVSTLTLLSVASPLAAWALCRPAGLFPLPALPQFSERLPALCCSPA